MMYQFVGGYARDHYVPVPPVNGFLVPCGVGCVIEDGQNRVEEMFRVEVCIFNRPFLLGVQKLTSLYVHEKNIWQHENQIIRT